MQATVHSTGADSSTFNCLNLLSQDRSAGRTHHLALPLPPTFLKLLSSAEESDFASYQEIACLHSWW